ncbi:MAG: hypothetical protein HY927_00355 [Elusimicrobia bacterium]|nr:hypothetical protein [Elusimicrobiota bacterium]
MGLLAWLGRRFGSRQESAGGFVQGERPDVIVHRHSGFRFPESVADFKGVGANQYDEGGRDVSVGYNCTTVPTVAVTVYVYPHAGAPGQALAEHFEQCKADVVSGHKNVRLLSEQALRIAPAGVQRDGKKAVFSFEDELAGIKLSSHSELYLFVHQGFFIKYRISYPDELKNQAPRALAPFLEALAWPGA